MKIGKLDNKTLDRLVLSKFHATRKESMGAPQVGQDCATLDFGSDLIVASCDPITSAEWEHLGALTVHVNCNDSASAGAEPVGLLVTLLMPPNGTEEQIDRIANDLRDAARTANVDILGGHTEVTASVSRPVTCTTVLARAPRDNAFLKPQADDALVLTKWAGLEGTMLAATDFSHLLPSLTEEQITRCRSFSSYLSVVPESKIALQNGVSAMHDVTEGGVLGAVWELASLYGLGAKIDYAAIPLLPETIAVCEAVSLDPARFISSGAMLIACRDGDRMCAALQQNGIHATVIGAFTERDFCLTDGSFFEPPGADELYKLFDIAKEKGISEKLLPQQKRI